VRAAGGRTAGKLADALVNSSVGQSQPGGDRLGVAAADDPLDAGADADGSVGVVLMMENHSYDNYSPDYVCGDVLDHTSVLNLVEQKWNLPALTWGSW
jgi:hypothetical protein